MNRDRRRVSRGLVRASVAALCALAALPAVATARDTVQVTDAPFGAVGDGTTNDRPAIQAAIDHVAARGGGTVVLPEGRTFLSGSVVLGSRVTLRVDGTLLQSQRTEDYAETPTRGHLYPSDIAYRYGDLAMLHNTPLVYAAHANGVAVEGAGTIQLTRAGGATPLEREHATIHAAAIGFYRVHDFAIRDVSMLGASSFSLGLYTVRDGIVEGTRIVASSEDANPVGGHNTDGISIQNSQRLRVTRNVVRTGDDGIYVWSSYRDERGGPTSWWSSDDPQPSTDVEIDHNDVVVDRRGGRLCCGAVVLIAWGGAGSPTGGNAPDRRAVQIADIHVHDNHLEAGYPFRCWCGSTAGQSPIARVTLERNEYVWGSPPGGNLRAQITDFETDADEWYPLMSAREVKNGDFEATGDAWWTPSGRAGATRAEDPTLDSDLARARLAEAGGWVGYVRTLPEEPAALMQGILPTSPQDLPIPVEEVQHDIAADVVTNGRPVRLVVRDRCDGEVVAERMVDAVEWTRVELSFAVTANACGGVRVGLESADHLPGWALIDDVAHQVSYEGSWIDSADPRVRLTGSWGVYPGAQDIGGSHLVGFARGANLTVGFAGTRAILMGTRDRNLGMGDVYIDGVRHGTADFYAATRVDGVAVYDTGPLPPGDHVFELRTTGTKNPASTNIYTVFDALVLEE
jgi:hypothetical protein